MSTRIAKICLIVYVVLLVLSLFLLSLPGDYWLWYACMMPFAIAPLFSGRNWHRIAGGIAVVLSGILIATDLQQGKHYHEELEKMRKRVAITNGQAGQAVNGIQLILAGTNQTPPAASSNH